MPNASAVKAGGGRSARQGEKSGGLGLRLVRAWLAVRRRNVRLIGGDRLPRSAAILRITHPATLPDALVVSAAAERPIAWVLDEAHMGGSAPVFAALGTILWRRDAAGWHRALRECTEALSSGKLVAVFDEQASGGAPMERAGFWLACEAWAAAYPDRFPVIVPLQLFRATARRQEYLVYVGGPIELNGDDDAPVAVSPAGLDAAFRSAFSEHVFGLDPAGLDHLLADVEQALRDQLEAEWRAESTRRQKVHGFRLSPMAEEAMRALNREQPEALMELLELAEADREARRQWSLVRLRAEFERRQLSSLHRLLGWAETVAGFPVALYGAVNHVLAAAVLIVAGLGPRRRDSTAAAWWARALVVVGAYAVQIALVNHELGRAGAGYYAATLPACGAYLVRYGWLLRRRTRILLLGARANWLQADSEKLRRNFYERLEKVLAAPARQAREA
jgi:hypothetical protein